MSDALPRERRWSWIASELGAVRDALERRHGRGTTVDDAVQNAALRAALARSEPRAGERVGWLRRIAERARIDEWRRARRSATPLTEAAHLSVEGLPADDTFDLRSALMRLTEDDRQLLAALAGGYTYAELGRRYRIRTSAVRQRALRARLRLLREWRREAE